MHTRNSTAPVSRLLLQGACIFLAALVLYALGAASAPLRPDEYYTVLAARSYAAEGVPRIGDGVYARASAFTAIVAASLTTFGDTMFAARLPALVPAALLVVLAFMWTRREAGVAAASFLAVFLVLSESTVDIAQFSRFYALHALLFFTCAVAVYALLSPHARTRTPAWKTVMGITAVCSGAAALYLQHTTLIGLVALAAWCAVAVAFHPGLRSRITLRGTVLAAALAVAILVALALLVDVPGGLARLYANYRWVELWNAENENNSRYYLHQLGAQIPVFFYTFPIAVLVALTRAPRAVVFCLVLASAAIVLHSFAGMKWLRYIHYLWPFLLLPTAVAFSVFASFAARAVCKAAAPRVAAGAVPASAVRPAIAGVVGLALLVALLGNPDYDRLRNLRRVAAAEFGLGQAAQAARSQAAAERETLAELQRLVDTTGYLVTSTELPALWHFGRFDLVLRPDRLTEFSPSGEFARDPRTGAVVIGQPESLARVMECRPSGLLIVWPFDWRRPNAVTAAVADLIERSMQAVQLPGSAPIRAFRWQRNAAATSGCEGVPARSPHVQAGSKVH